MAKTMDEEIKEISSENGSPERVFQEVLTKNDETP
jgi:hypothetical protein